MIADRKRFAAGALLFAGFVAVFAVMLTPVFEGQNALDYMDSLYNSISKGSAYYVPELRETVRKVEGKAVAVTLNLESEQAALETAPLFETCGTLKSVEGAKVSVEGSLAAVCSSALEDADWMFANNGEKVRAKYGGADERRVMYRWWTAFKALDKELSKQKKFAEAEVLQTVSKKGLECSYNYYGIEPQKITERLGIVVFSLLFYVVYTVWYGFSILLMFEGWGMRLSH